MNTGTECERVRITLMAALDGELGPQFEADHQHLAACSSCRGWLNDLQSMTGRLQGLSYPRAEVDLWTAVESRIGDGDKTLPLPGRLWPTVAAMLAWRILQLFVDVPMPLLHPVVPLAATIAAVWLVVGDPLAIQTWAPELQKRGA